MVPILVLALLLPALVVPALAVGATAIDYNDLNPSIKVDGDNDIVTITFDPSGGRWDYFGDSYGFALGASVVLPQSSSLNSSYWPFPELTGISPEGIPDDTMFDVEIKYGFPTQVSQDTTKLAGRLGLLYYNANGQRVANTLGPWVKVVPGLTNTFNLTCPYKVFSDVFYIGPSINLYDIVTDYELTVTVISCSLTMRISSLYRLQQQTGKTNKLLTEVNKQLEENGQKLDEILKQPEQEKAEANQTGNSSVDGIVSGIPDKGKEFQSAVKQFAASASYEGTEAKLPIPAVKMPEIPGLVPGVTLLEPQQLDFGEYITIIPAPLLTLAQSILTVALIVFCFKELYDTIQYVLTLKGGGGA